MKKILIFFIIFSIASFGKINDYNLKNQKIIEEINFNNINLEEAFLIISKDTKTSFITAADINAIPVNLKISSGENMETLVNTLITVYNLDVRTVGNSYLVTKKINTSGKHIVYGQISQEDFDEGIDGVRVTLANSEVLPTYSRNNGKYIIPNIEPGVYILQFSKKGYKTRSELIDVKDEKTIVNSYLHRLNSLKKIKKPNDEKDYLLVKKIPTENGEIIKEILLERYPSKLKVNLIKDGIILTGSKKNIIAARNIIKEIDGDKPQFQISSQILDVSNNLFENLGFTWIYNNNTQGTKGTNVSVLESSTLMGAGNVISSGINMTRRFSSGTDILNLGIDMLSATQDLVVSARPSILVVDGEEGSFKVTEEVIVGEKKDENESNDKVTKTPIFKEAGIILKVKPHLLDSGDIILDTLIEVSNFKLKYNKDSSGTYNSEGGSKVARQIKTKIKIKNGQTIFIGGLKKATVRKLNSHFPIFGTMPMIKYLFKNDNMAHEIVDIYIKLKVDLQNEPQATTFDKDEIHKMYINNNTIF